MEQNMTHFERGQKDTFKLEAPTQPLGDVCSVKIWQENGGLAATWHLDSLSLVQLDTRRQWDFKHSGWVPKVSSGSYPIGCPRAAVVGGSPG